MLGAVGDGWAQVTSELAFERSGPERFLSVMPLLSEAALCAADNNLERLGRLYARVIALRRLSCGVVEAIDREQPVDVDAALVKDFGTIYEQEAVEELQLLDGPRSARFEELLSHAQLRRAELHASRRHHRGAARDHRPDAGQLMAAAPDLFDADVDQLLVETADELFARHGGQDALRELAGGGWSPELWRHVEEIGLASLGVPADAGGGDGSVAHLASVLRMAGRHAVQLPLASTAIARWALAQAGVQVPDGPLAIAAAGVSGGTVSAGRVPHARDCTIVLVADGRVGVVAPHAASISTGTNVAGEPRDDVVTSFDAVAWVAAEGIVEAFELRAALAVRPSGQNSSRRCAEHRRSST